MAFPLSVSLAACLFTPAEFNSRPLKLKKMCAAAAFRILYRFRSYLQVKSLSLSLKQTFYVPVAILQRVVLLLREYRWKISTLQICILLMMLCDTYFFFLGRGE